MKLTLFHHRQFYGRCRRPFTHPRPGRHPELVGALGEVGEGVSVGLGVEGMLGWRAAVRGPVMEGVAEEKAGRGVWR